MQTTQTIARQGLTWTKPYYGVQHLKGRRQLESPRVFQVTVENYDSFVEWYVLCLQSDHAFTPIREGRVESVEQARTEAERAFLAIVGA